MVFLEFSRVLKWIPSRRFFNYMMDYGSFLQILRDDIQKKIYFSNLQVFFTPKAVQFQKLFFFLSKFH